MRRIILIRHSNPEIQQDQTASHWQLSDLGKCRARALSPILSHYHPSCVYSSIEPKAVETAAILAGSLNIPSESHNGLHEHERSHVLWSTRERFASQVAELFARPNELVFGDETADQAVSRFSDAVAKLRENHADDTIAIVCHGTVMTLFVSYWNDIDPFQFWGSLDMPSMVVLSPGSFKLEDVISVDDSRYIE